MRRFSRDTWLAFGLVAFLVLITALAVAWQTREKITPALASSSSEPTGAKAFKLWLDEKGYDVKTQYELDFSIPENSELVFVLEPYYRLEDPHWQVLDDWVRKGGFLIVAGQDWGVDAVFSHYNFETGQATGQASYGIHPTEQTPLLAAPPLTDLSHLEVVSAFSTNRDDFVTYLAVDSAPVLVTFRQGEGRVILASFNYPFTNAGLKEPGNPELILNLLALAGSREHIWLDEWHHNTQEQSLRVVGLQDWLRYTTAGHAVLWIAAIAFLALVFHGRPFGRPVPMPSGTARRTSLEYITALANLSRRAGHRSEVLKHYRLALKNNLARRYRLDPEMPDDEFVAQAGRIQPDLDVDGLLGLLRRLGQPRVSELSLVQAAAEAAEWLREPASYARP